nr:MAG TPA: hypothetical protein [Bacteriophage sp.]
MCIIYNVNRLKTIIKSFIIPLKEREVRNNAYL